MVTNLILKTSRRSVLCTTWRLAETTDVLTVSTWDTV